jgi:hypothetical protein
MVKGLGMTNLTNPVVLARVPITKTIESRASGKNNRFVFIQTVIVNRLGNERKVGIKTVPQAVAIARPVLQFTTQNSKEKDQGEYWKIFIHVLFKLN